MASGVYLGLEFHRYCFQYLTLTRLQGQYNYFWDSLDEAMSTTNTLLQVSLSPLIDNLFILAMQ